MEILKKSGKELSSIKIGGEVSYTEVKNDTELLEAIKYAFTNELRLHILGEGTNTFFSDEPKNVLVVRNMYTEVRKEEKDDNVYFSSGAGENWDNLVKRSIDESLWGLENLSGIPGTVGAGPIQNIGAYGAEIKDVLEWVRAYDLNSKSFIILKNSECNFSYRNSLFKESNGRYIITHVNLKLSKIPKPNLEYKPLDILKEKNNLTSNEVRELVLKTRSEKLPDYKEFPNVGSFFKNPIVDEFKYFEVRNKFENIPEIKSGSNYKLSAAWLIDNVAKMKGVREGDVGTWPTQPLVLVNYASATALELINFSEKLKKVIKEKAGVILDREVVFIE